MSAQPPKHVEAERATLGAVLLNPAALDDVLAILGAVGDRFTVEAHAEVFEAIVDLTSRGRPVDEVTLFNELNGKHASLIGELVRAVPTSYHAAHYATIVRDKANERALVTLARQIAAQAAGGELDSDAQLDAAEAGLLEISNTRHTANVLSAETATAAAVADIRATHNQGDTSGGIALGIAELDQLLGGWKAGSLNIIAARPSVGKTAFALNVTHHAAKLGTFALFFSLEMSASQLAQRMISIDGGAQLGRIRLGFQADAELAKVDSAARRLSDFPIAIDDTPGQTLAAVRSTARRHIRKAGGGLIVVDYLQLMRSAPATRGKQIQRYQEIGEISRGLKQLARELDAPVIACCQLGRSADAETDGFRMMSHLRESGDIEQDADTITILARPAPEVIKEAGEGGKSLVSATVAKHRNGATGSADLFFDKPAQRFRALTGAHAQDYEPADEYAGDAEF